MEIQVNVHDWLQLPMETRVKIREMFKVPKSEGAWVENGMVRSDGTTYKDLQAITPEKMQAFLGSEETDFVKLFHATTAKVQEDLDAELEPVEKPDPNQFMLEEWASHLTRMETQAKTLGLTEHFTLLISKFLPNANDNTRQSKTAGQGQKAEQKRPAKGNSKAAKASAGSDMAPTA